METAQNKIDRLIDFKQRDKFSAKAWNERGLNPSSTELCEYLNQFFNNCADKLINEVKNESSINQLKKILKSELAGLNKSYYDTEEKEFIGDLFHELAAIVEVDFNETLNRWLYGSLLSTLIKIQKIIRPERIIETHLQPCTRCEKELETQILTKIEGKPETDWLIVKCNNCKGLNLISLGPDIGRTRFQNFQLIEILSMREYTYEQAQTRLEQIQFFRKL